MLVPEFDTKKELFGWLVTNKKLLVASKTNVIKEADCIEYMPSLKINNAIESKAATTATNEIQAKLVLNTTNWMDSHSDVHIPGLWAKTLSENKSIYLLQEHRMEFNKIISDEVKATVSNKTFRELGFDFDGTTQALIFDATIKSDRNPFMYNQYKNGWVKNHSVGMRYIKIVMCIDDSEYGAEFEAWEKYYPMVANKEQCKDKGYFWAVTEAKLIEGSAVPIGSNVVTPTLEINEKAASDSTFNIEPLISTQNKTNGVDWNKISTMLIN